MRPKDCLIFYYTLLLGFVKQSLTKRLPPKVSGSNKTHLFYISGHLKSDCINRLLGVKFAINFEELSEGTVCKVGVTAVDSSQIIHFDNEVYIRDGNVTRKLEGRALTDWIQQRGN